MPIDKDTHKLNENYERKMGMMNFTSLRPPSSLEDVKKFGKDRDGAAHGLDVKGQESEIGYADDAPTKPNPEEDSENVEMDHKHIIATLKKALAALEKHAKKDHDEEEE